MIKKKKEPEQDKRVEGQLNTQDALEELKFTDESLNKNDEIQLDIEKLIGEVQEANEKYLRLYAEFDNFKRRTLKERTELLQAAGKDILLALLPIIDDFERALKSMEAATEVNSLKEGVSLINNKLKNMLHLKGLKAMESIGQVFNPDIHEAITNAPAPNEDLKGKVIDEVEKGYYLNDKVLRFAKVVVGA